MAADDHVSALYKKKAIPFSLNQRLVRPQQLKLYRAFERSFPPGRQQKVLDLGVNGSLESAEEYFFEANYPFLDRVVACGLEEGSLFSSFYPEVEYVRVERGKPLPFREGEFDVVFCNAVIEHVGSRETQGEFLRDILRVGRAAFVTTPNRWFPIELHTILPLVHYLPTPLYRWIFRQIGFGFFAREENLNLLDRRSFAALVDPGRRSELHANSLLGFTSNLLLVVKPGSESSPD